ncbi:MAG: glycosyltransferase [Gammaproteobacteria bacterium]|nr:glycosyltransferase [Gammaproteobacteria bacterium]
MAPKLSILLPYKNAADTLDECLTSIAQQTLQAYELLAIDDHSTDQSYACVAARARTDPRIRHLLNPGQGIVAALNFGLTQSCTPFIVRMDADDRMLPERLQKQYECLRDDPHLSLLGTQVRAFARGRIEDGFNEYLAWQNQCLEHQDIIRDIYVESPFAHPSLAFRRDPVIEIGGYRDGTFPEDYDLWLRLYQTGHLMKKIPEVLLEWRDSRTRTSRTDPRCSRQAFDRIRAHYLARDPLLLDRKNNLVVWGAGRKSRKRCELLLVQGFETKAWIDIDPKKIGNVIIHVPVVAPAWLRRTPRPFVLVYVNNHGARQLIGESLAAMSYRPREDYLMIG